MKNATLQTVTSRRARTFFVLLLLMTGASLAQAQVSEIPQALVISRDGRKIQDPIGPAFALDTLGVGDTLDVTEAPPCLPGQYYLAFQLEYDLGDRNTATPWTCDLSLTLLHDDDSIWTKPLRVAMADQTFVSTIFHDSIISCADNYRLVIAQKNASGGTPLENIYLRFLLCRKPEAAFNPAAEVLLSATYSDHSTSINWTTSAESVLEYDVEWVFIEAHDHFSADTATAGEAFAFKEPVRISTPGMQYKHLVYYPDGTLWYRIRAVGYDPAYPDHRILGQWFYSPYESVTNHEPQKTWQEQTVFAEEGKYKKVISYFDGSMRQRQTQTNLNTEEVTLVAETLYDFEGRQSVNVLSVPALNQSLAFKPGFNVFESQDTVVQNRTSAERQKFHYDNYRIVNSTLSDESGAGQYYSAANSHQMLHKNYIPDAQGFVFSQTEYLNDGTGRVTRQSGVGEEFRMEGEHVMRYYYNTAASEELIRLFGSNVGNATHYKKNMVVDPNGQVSISYLDQEDRVIATALAGEKPENVAALTSYPAEPDLITIDLTDKNVTRDHTRAISHKIANTSPSTSYAFRYDLSAITDSIEHIGCVSCGFDLTITITDPEGALVQLPLIPGNGSADRLSYTRAILADSCGVENVLVEFDVLLAEIGDYTVTKKLTAHEMSFEEIKTIVLKDSTYSTTISDLWSGYVVDPGDCEICSQTCPEADSIVNNVINEIAVQDCDNIYRQIVQYYQDLHPDSIDYEPTQGELEAHELWCQYQLCNKDIDSDIFDKQMARVEGWSAAVAARYHRVDSLVLYRDPFFFSQRSGDGEESSMLSSLNNISLLPGMSGSILEVTDPDNTDFFVDDEGNHDATHGKHVLYMDLVSKQSQMTQPEYDDEEDQQRWVLFKSFYVEAKRKIKLEVYDDCPAALKDLRATDDMIALDTEEEIKDWAEENGMDVDSVSEEEVVMSYYSIRHNCDADISPADSASIASNLEAYFNGNPRNFFRLILISDLTTNPHLLAIKDTLDNYGCGLDSVAVDDPIVCVRDTTVFIHKSIAPPFMAMRSSSMETDSANSMTDTEAGFQANGFEEQRKWMEEEIEKVKESIRAKALADEPKDKARLRSSQSVALLMSPPLPSQPEYDALVALYNSTNGDEWVDTTNWNPLSGPAQDVSDWFGVTVDESTGHIIKIELGSNKLIGSLPDEIANLTYLQTLSLASNTSGPLFPSRNILDSIPSAIGEMTALKSLNMTGCSLGGTIPGSMGKLINLQFLYLNRNQLTGPIPDSLTFATELWIVDLGRNSLSGEIPASINRLTILQSFTASLNNLSGPIPGTLNELPLLALFDVSQNHLSGSIPSSVGRMTGLQFFGASFNELTGGLPASLDSLPTNSIFWVGFNNLSERIPPQVRSGPNNIDISRNELTFEDLLDVLPPFGVINYSFQDSVDVKKKLTVIAGGSLTLSATVDRTTNPRSKYQWFKDGVSMTSLDTASHTYIINDVSWGDVGNYYYIIKNQDAPSLTLTSRIQEVVLLDSIPQTICLEYDTTNTTLNRFRYVINWNNIVEKCLADAAREDTILVEYAIEKLIEGEATDFYFNHLTNCLANSTDSLFYTYAPKEHHYTLYYYDQAGNLAQTVPPNGVHPLTYPQVRAFLRGVKTDPGHTMITRYQYSSLNQLLWQKTPDAGESRFWYNDKAELRLSQNAQQLKDHHYSYIKYDEQGRSIEAGEMLTEDSLTVLIDTLAWPSFPIHGATYQLSDISLTHYDLGRSSLQEDFPQSNLRTRVAWVEVIEKGRTDTLATYYSYDIHGNVRSLLQHIPGLSDKRTDYVYDLVSGKMNYVLYQYGEHDQLIHQYTYDADNRLTDVHTSTDGYLWDHDARYFYYLHGPLARIELGEYRVQGLDYYYSLQGWLKGVNMPYEDDPNDDGYASSTVGRDVFAFTLGYYQDDYQIIGSSILLSDTRDQLWTRYDESMDNSGLFNGNISWMVTDLKKIGQQKGARAKGMQAMLYQYDQLHRIIQGRSLTSYAPGTGFESRTISPSPYDENYTYDPNGNILTLNRRDDQAGVLNDFHYDYYTGTNKLKYLDPVVRDTVYRGAVISNNKVYRNITVDSTSYVPAGRNVELRATENIYITDDFEIQDDANFHAYVLTDEEGAYVYDAIGNLIWDQEQGVKIQWTPSGKVRQVTTKGDSTVVMFRYDAMGNRVEKSVVKTDTAYVTRYARDGNGKVMAVYNDTLLTEQTVYGSARLGMFRGHRDLAQRRLGAKQYELSNHLGNVLSVITDNVGISADSAWAVVVNAIDYYPFGLEMKGRVYSDSTYRYGFNGKEKDDSGEFGNTHYDYGFRIYDPTIGRFLSVDPLTGSYPWYTPYQFAGNKPIMAVDLDGLEELTAIDGSKVGGPRDMYQINSAIVRQYADNVKKAMNQQPPQSSPNAPSIKSNPFANELPSVRQARTNTAKYERAVEEGNRRGQTTHPFMYGGGEFGFGFARTMADGMHQASYMVVQELAVAQLTELYYLNKLLAMEKANPGAHLVSRHGAGTTLAQQLERALTGLTPDKYPGIPLNSTRFLSYEYQYKIIMEAQKKFLQTGETAVPVEAGVIIGEGYLKYGRGYRTATEATVVFKNGKPYTAYPKLLTPKSSP